MTLSPAEVEEQSKNAYAQWKNTWAAHATKNGKLFHKNGTSHQDALYCGVGKRLLIVATGPSLEAEMENIKKYRDEVDIMCVDKSYHMLVEHGVIPDFVVICDAGISYDKYCKPYLEQTKDVTLLSNITANPDWTHNWKGRIIFFVNKDNIQTELEYMQLSGVPKSEIIPAGSNVGNSCVIFASQVMGYRAYGLIGYDFGWRNNQNYYSYDTTTEKRYWMKHMAMIDLNGDIINTSQNLSFSSRWLTDFYRGILYPAKIEVYNCTDGGTLGVMPRMGLEKFMTLPVDKPTQEEKSMIASRRAKHIIVTSEQGENVLNEVLKSHDVMQVTITHLPEETAQWLNSI